MALMSGHMKGKAKRNKLLFGLGDKNNGGFFIYLVPKEKRRYNDLYLLRIRSKVEKDHFDLYMRENEALKIALVILAGILSKQGKNMMFHKGTVAKLQSTGRLATVPWGRVVQMLPKSEIIALYNGYKAKYEQLKGKRNSDIGYVSERIVVKWMIELLEKILNGDK